MATDEERHKTNMVILKAKEVIQQDVNGNSPSHDVVQKMDVAHKEAKKNLKESMDEVKAGITNEAAKNYVKKLSLELRDLKVQNAKKGMEIQLLQKNQELGYEDIKLEVVKFKDYLAGFTGVVNNFIERTEQSLEFRQSGVHESKRTTSGTTESS